MDAGSNLGSCHEIYWRLRSLADQAVTQNFCFQENDDLSEKENKQRIQIELLESNQEELAKKNNSNLKVCHTMRHIILWFVVPSSTCWFLYWLVSFKMHATSNTCSTSRYRGSPQPNLPIFRTSSG